MSNREPDSAQEATRTNQITSGTDREVEHIYVVCGGAGKPHRAYHEREHAEELLEHWREGQMNVKGTIECVDLVEFRSLHTGSE